MGVLYYLSYLAILAGFAFVTLSLASGLLYVSELIEEHSRVAKTVGQRMIYAVISLHVILYITDSLPFLPTAFSILCHVVYLRNFSPSWPLIELTSISFVASCALVVADHFIWFFYFARLTNEARKLRSYRVVIPEPPGFLEIASFFGFCIWLVPLFLFLSLSANDHAIPMSSIEHSGSPRSFSSQQAQPGSRVSLIRSLFSMLPLKSSPRGQRLTRKDTSEGLIAPRSPVPRAASPLPPNYPPLSPRPSYLSPPKSPMLRGQELEVHNTTSSTFNLNTPPRRSTDSLQARPHAGDSLGLGLRRTSSYVQEHDS